MAAALSELEQQMAAALQRLTPASTQPAGAEGGAPDRKAAESAAIQRRQAAHRSWAAIQRRQTAHRGWVADAESEALVSARSLADQAFSRQGTREQLRGFKDQLRDLQSQLTDALSLQLCKESKCRLATEWISDATAANEGLGNSVEDFRDKRDKRAAVISEQLQALQPLEAKSNEDAALQEKMEEALFWYRKFLGFQLVVGEGDVKFVFNEIDPQNPEKEYSFCMNVDRDGYKLIECDPHIKDAEELVKDLNLSGHLLKFVRAIREKFQSSAISSAINGTVPASQDGDPDVSAAPFPSPMVTSINNISEDAPNQSQSQSKNKMQLLPAKRGATTLSASSPGVLRRSPRFKPS